MGASSRSSSDIDDDEAERLRSVAVDSASIVGVAAALFEKNKKKKNYHPTSTDDEAAAPALKFYQARARDFLHKYLDNTLEIKPVNSEGTEAQIHFVEVSEDTGFHLFKSAPSGLSDKRHRHEADSIRERKVQDVEVDEGSETFQSSLLATAVDGIAVKQHAETAKAQAFASWVLHQAEENEAKRKEEERVALLKMQRGEQWLPSVVRDMQIDNISGGNLSMKVASISTLNTAKANVPYSQPHFPAKKGDIGIDSSAKASTRKSKPRKSSFSS